jgi:transforming growth factor-beta-induced protein
LISRRYIFVFITFSLIGLVGGAGCGAPVEIPGAADVIATLPPPGTGSDAAAPAVTSAGAAVVSSGSVVGTGDEITEVIRGESELLFTVTALNATNLWPLLEEPGPYTFFAPSNVAFSRTGMAPQQMDGDTIFAIMQNHIVEGMYTADNLAVGLELTTLAGEPLATTGGGDLQVAYSQVLVADLRAGNGVVHIIDNLLLPPERGEQISAWGVLVGDGRFSQLRGYLEGTELMYMLRFDPQVDAFLAPTDDAFAALPTAIRSQIESNPEALLALFRYHFLMPDGWSDANPFLLADMQTFSEIPTLAPVSGSGAGFGFLKVSVTEAADGSLRLDGAALLETDIIADNGAVHVVDTVLVPAVLEN